MYKAAGKRATLRSDQVPDGGGGGGDREREERLLHPSKEPFQRKKNVYILFPVIFPTQYHIHRFVYGLHIVSSQPPTYSPCAVRGLNALELLRERDVCHHLSAAEKILRALLS